MSHPYQILLSDEEWALLEEGRKRLGVRHKVEYIRHLLKKDNEIESRKEPRRD